MCDDNGVNNDADRHPFEINNDYADYDKPWYKENYDDATDNGSNNNNNGDGDIIIIIIIIIIIALI